MRHLDLSRFKNASSLASGRHSALFSGSGLEFKELREYADGNDARAIDWKSSLRSGKTLARTYVADHEIPVWFVLDVSSSMGYGPVGGRPIDTALKAFDLVAASARKHGNSFGAIAFSDRVVAELTPTRSLSRAVAFRESVEAAVESRSQIEFSKAFPVDVLRSRIRSKSVVFVVSDRDFEVPSGFWRSLKRSHGFFLRARHPAEDSELLSDIAAYSEGKGFSFVSAEAAHAVSGKSRPNAAEIPSGSDPYFALHALLSGNA
jgi:uncharacterized protein (DUF58 family)